MSNHHDWFRKISADMAGDYSDQHKIARDDAQKSGHLAEDAWAKFLAGWLPSNYPVGKRKYIIPETGDDEFETDLVVFNPAYPKRLRDETHVLSGGVAAAFYVRLTLDAGGITDAIGRSKRLKESLVPRAGSARQELVPQFPVGLLATSHEWKAPKSDPRKNIRERLLNEHPSHPRMALDYVCVADLATWYYNRTPYLGPQVAALAPGHSERQLRDGFVCTAYIESESEVHAIAPAIATFVSHLWGRLARFDSTLEPLTTMFRMTHTLGSGSGKQLWWDLNSVYSDDVLQQIPNRVAGPDWSPSLFD